LLVFRKNTLIKKCVGGLFVFIGIMFV